MNPSATPRAERVARPSAEGTSGRDRSAAAEAWYNVVRYASLTVFAATGGLRAEGRDHIPARGGVLLVSNHLSHLDSFVLGITANRPLNFVARSTLFLPGLGAFIRSVGGFPIQREGMGASGLKETLRRLRNGAVVTLFVEGTRSDDGEVAAVKPGIGVLAARSRVPIVPVAIAGTFESFSKHRLFPRPHAVRLVYGPALLPPDVAGLKPEALADLIRERLRDCLRRARHGLNSDLGGSPPVEAESTLGKIPEFD